MVIEGFPRSANTYVTYAIYALSQESMTIAHHLHHPGQFERARRHGKPAFILIRRPEDAIRSLRHKYPGRTVPLLLIEYWLFYRLATHYCKEATVIEFSSATDWTELCRLYEARFGPIRDEDRARQVVQQLMLSRTHSKNSPTPKIELRLGWLSRWLLRACDEMYKRVAGEGNERADGAKGRAGSVP